MTYLGYDDDIAQLDKIVCDRFDNKRSIYDFNEELPDFLREIEQTDDFDTWKLELLKAKYEYDLQENLQLKLFLGGSIALLGFCIPQLISSFHEFALKYPENFQNTDHFITFGDSPLLPFVIPFVTYVVLFYWVKSNDKIKHCLRAVNLLLFQLQFESDIPIPKHSNDSA